MTFRRIKRVIRQALLSALAILLSQAALAKSPEGPVPLTLDEALNGATVLVAKGTKIRWLTFHGGAVDGPQEVFGPSDKSGHFGYVELEADVLEILHCELTCSDQKKIFIRLDGYAGLLDKLGYFVQEPLIFLVRPSVSFDSAFPLEKKPIWHVQLIDTRDALGNHVHALPLSAIPKVKSAMRKLYKD